MNQNGHLSAAKQTLDGKRAVTPRFFAAVCSTLGEYGQDTFELSELITAAFKEKMVRMGDRCDDQKPAWLSAAFRNKLRTLIQFAVGKGFSQNIALFRLLVEANLCRRRTPFGMPCYSALGCF